MKKAFIMFFSFILSFSLLTPPAKAAQFTDVTTTNRFYQEILFLAGNGVISGFPNGKFKPGQEVTRAAAAIIIGKALNLDGQKRNTQFKDVNAGNMASGYIASAVEKGIVSGFPDGTFRPNEFVTRGQMAILLSKAFDLTTEEDVHFSDVTPLVTAYPYIKKLTAAGIASGYEDHTYKPNLILRRDQFAAFMARALNPAFIPGNKVSDFTVNFLNVGQGDAVFIEFPNGQTMLIDAGPSEEAIRRELASLEVNTIDIFVATHPGDEHIGGADYVIHEMNVEKIFDSGMPGVTKEYKEYSEAAKAKKLKLKEVHTGSRLSPDDQVNVTVLHADSRSSAGDDGSIVIHMTYGDISYLFASEIGTSVENQLMSTSDIQADILKVSKRGTSQAFIEAVDPLIAVLSTDHSTDNAAAEIRQRLETYGTQILSTVEGTIMTTSSQESFYLYQKNPHEPSELPFSKLSTPPLEERSNFYFKK
ncbi:S-layer homology domain-containing protein [Bacillus sp. B190/17]|uniref:S-layer homology domain-containing protein n=1 Tax=Bacillus lumedeiriae TaxID=3058829 RepID=A0ABW8IAV6_9BACI